MRYESAEYKIKVVSSGTFDIKLLEKSIELDEVVILSRRPDHNVTSCKRHFKISIGNI